MVQFVIATIGEIAATAQWRPLPFPFRQSESATRTGRFGRGGDKCRDQGLGARPGRLKLAVSHCILAEL